MHRCCHFPLSQCMTRERPPAVFRFSRKLPRISKDFWLDQEILGDYSLSENERYTQRLGLVL